MAIKVIKEGVNPETRPIRATCRSCHSVIEFLPSDAAIVYDWRDGNFYKLPCPVCSADIHHDVDPRFVR